MAEMEPACLSDEILSLKILDDGLILRCAVGNEPSDGGVLENLVLLKTVIASAVIVKHDDKLLFHRERCLYIFYLILERLVL